MKYLPLIFLAGTMLLGACNKFVETPMPDGQLPSESIFENDKLLTAALNGVYGTIGNSIYSWVTYPPYFADEIINPNASGNALDAQENTYSPEIDYKFWTNYYTALYNANAILEALETPNGNLSAAVIKQVKGESLFLRAYCYFYLVNYYGDVPLVKSTDASVTSLLPQTPAADVYKSITDDLEAAAEVLDDNYPSANRWRVNKQAANALLSKVYLYTHEWAKAEATASNVINSELYGIVTDPDAVFRVGSNETIWQLWNQDGHNSVSTSYVPSDTTAVNFRVREELLQAFETGDLRRTHWVKAGADASASLYYPYKYKLRAVTTDNTAEYNIQLRLADIYLVRAEARAQQGNTTEGNEDLYIVRKRAGLLQEPAYASAESLVNAVLEERRRELMFENAERWFDLKRSGQAISVLSSLKTGFTERALLLPIPNTILASNPNLKQNKDY